MEIFSIFHPIILSWIGDLILAGIEKAVWYIFVTGPLILLSAFDTVIKYLSGGIVWDVIFGGKDFSPTNLPIPFIGFIIVGTALWMLIFLVQMINAFMGDESKIGAKLLKSLKMSSLAILFIFLIPVVFFLINVLISQLIYLLPAIFGMKNYNIADVVYHIGDPNWTDGAITPVTDYGPPGNILDWNIIAEIFGVWFMLFSCAMLGLTLVQKMFELFFLFLIGPIVAFMMVADDGKRMLTWKDMVIGKFFAGLTTLISFYIFTISVSIVCHEAAKDMPWAERQLLIILFICGAALATLGISQLIAALIGESAGIREGMSSLRSTLAGGMATLGAAKMVGKAIGFGKSKYKSPKPKQNELSKKLFKSTLGNGKNDFGVNDAIKEDIENGGNGTPNNGPIPSYNNPLQGHGGLVGALGWFGTGIAASLGYAAGKVAKVNQEVEEAEGKKPNKLFKFSNAITTGTSALIASPFAGIKHSIKSATKNVGQKIKHSTASGFHAAKNAVVPKPVPIKKSEAIKSDGASQPGGSNDTKSKEQKQEPLTEVEKIRAELQEQQLEMARRRIAAADEQMNWKKRKWRKR